jgi:hypothetical protein
MVSSKRMAPSTRSPLNFGLWTMRLRIWWMTSNISASLE